jgi:transposase
MRYEISDYEWGVINPMLPNKPRGVRLTTIGYVRFYSADCVHERCCWQIEVMTRTGSEHSSASKAGGQTSRRNEIARSRFASALISTAHVTWSNGSSIKSSNVGVSPSRSQLSCLHQARIHPDLAKRL